MKPFLTALALSVLFAACGAPRQVSVLIRMMPEQEKYFRERIIPPFEKKNRCKVEVVSYRETGDLDSSIRKLPGRCALVKTPLEQTRKLVDEGLMMPVDSVAGQDMAGVQQAYFLLSLATVDGRLYYYPRKFETRIMVYLKSKVREAVMRWGDRSDEIDSVLKKYTGHGLPNDFVLEEDPNQWDYYDLFTAGYYWSREIPGRYTPKIAHRGKRYSGTAQTLVDRVYQLGGDQGSVMAMEGDGVLDMLEWEALCVKTGIYNPRMWADSLSGAGVWGLFKSGECYLSFMTQLDCFFLHGNYSAEQPGYVANPDDLGFAVMPRGVSLSVDSAGKPVREGRRSISTGGWWWGVPKDTPYRDLSAKLAEWILSPQVQIDESAAFGMIPVRKDVLGDIGLLFGRGWITDIYEVSFKQLIENQFTTVPLIRNYAQLENLYLDAWYDIAVSGNCGQDGTVSRDFIRNRLLLNYSNRARAIAGPAEKP